MYISDQSDELCRSSHIRLSIRLYIRVLVSQILWYRCANLHMSVSSQKATHLSNIGPL